ncbi:MAG: mercuric reductase [Ectothiorhodospiraceae bacterium]|nr:mercuric reductase [Ectothiorhodospiraceae bacterium]
MGDGSRRHDLVIIGGGVGGLVTASVAGQLGLDVVLIEREPNLGGDCLHYGCVPSKTLIRSAEVARLARDAERFGISVSTVSVDLEKVMDRVRGVIARIQPHDDPERFRGYGVDVRFGTARFLDSHTVDVDGEAIAGRRFVIATGSRPVAPPIPGLEAVDYLTNETVFAEKRLPERLAVLGGGPIGLELAQAFQRLGSQVTVLEMAPQILPREDPEIAASLRDALIAEGLDVRTGVTVDRVDGEAGLHRLHCRAGEQKEIVEADRLLIAAGRSPNTDALDLDRAGVANDRAGIRVDARMRTTAKHIFACGDVCGPYPFTHMAEYQAGIIIANAIFRVPKKADYRVVPWVTYTDPEVAHVGLTEQQALDQGLAVQIARFPFGEVDRALAEGSEHGLAKLVVHKGRLVGASMVGAHAGELIHELVLAMQARLKIGQIAAAIHAYPTLAQIHRRAVNSLYSPKLFAPGTRRLVHWINRLLP